MLNTLLKWRGTVEINGVLYDSIEDAQKIVTEQNISIECIFLHAEQKNAEKRRKTQNNTN